VSGVKDLDMENRYSWQGVLEMLMALCGEAADLSFDYRVLGEKKLPSLEIRLDRPAELREPQSAVEEGIDRETWNFGTVVLTDRIPEDLPDGPVWLLRRSGAAAVAYRAFRETVKVLNRLGLPAEFSWSSIPLAPICDDLSITARRERICCSQGAIHTIWVRCPEDEQLKKALRSSKECGQLMVQNMSTANTWIAGGVDEDLLSREIYGICDR